MAQYAWVLGVRPGYEEEYKRRHDDIWPEMVEGLRSAGISNYSIFRHGLTLFGYFETDDLKKTQAYLGKQRDQPPLERVDGPYHEGRHRPHHRLPIPPPFAMAHGLAALFVCSVCSPTPTFLRYRR